MEKIRFKNGIVEDYTIILSNKALQHLGQLTGVSNVKFSANLNSANTISFVVNKLDLKPIEGASYEDIKAYQDYIWENLIDFKTIYVKELKEYFEIRVAIEDGKDTKKSINGTSLCEAELSQTNLYTIEINTESDIARGDYEVTTFYNAKNEACSLLHRILKKAPHYHIGHVDGSLCKLQRTFSIDGTSIYDFLTGECAEQFDCLFLFDSETRSISAYDLKSFGKDTTIYVDTSNLTESIHFEMNGDNVKNCFKLEAGDADMTAAIRALNPNGSDYLYIIRDDDRKDMPQELVDKLDKYSEDLLNAELPIKEITARRRDLTDKVEYYRNTMMPSIQSLDSNQTLDDIKEPKEGIIYMFGNMAYLFDGAEFVPQNDYTQFLLELAPTFETATAKTEAAKLTTAALGSIGLQDLHQQTSLATINAAIKNYAKVFVKSAYVKLEIEDELTDPSITFDVQKRLWHGRIKVTNLSNKEDVAYTGYMDIPVTSNYQTFLAQKIDKTIKNSDDDKGSVFDVLSIEDMDNFQKALTLYCESRLTSFRDAIGLVIDLLDTKGITKSIEDRNDPKNAELVQLQDSLLLPYQAKASACEKQIKEIQTKISDLLNVQAVLDTERETIQKELNLETRLGDLYPIFCSYKREDKYSNSNYISDGLNNTQIIERAEEFWDLARKEIEKSANGQYNISSTLYNLLVMKEFEPIVEHFELGNWIRVKVDGEPNPPQLRLIGYEIDFSNLQTINVTFSTATRVPNLKDERKSILESAKNMATNFGYVSKQAEKGQQANNNMHSIVQNGLDSGLVTIKNNNREEVTYGNYGILLREYDDILDDYTDNQCKLTHNAMVYTTDNWNTAAQAIGEHTFSYYNTSTNKLEQAIGYGVTAQFCQSAYIYGGQIVSADIYSEDYNPSAGTGSHIGLRGFGEFNFGNVLTFDGENLYVDGNGTFSGTIKAKNGYIGSDDYPYQWVIGNDNARAYIYNGTNSMTSTTTGTYLGTDGFRNYNSSSKYVNISGGILSCNGANITGTITSSTIDGGTIKGAIITTGDGFSVDSTGNIKASKGTIGGWTIGNSSLTGGNVTLNDSGALSGKNWSITSEGTATFNDIKITGGSVAGNTISTYSLDVNKMANTVWEKVNTLSIANITATRINSLFSNGTFLLSPFIHSNLVSLHKNTSLTGTVTISLDGEAGLIKCSQLEVNGTKSRIVSTQSYSNRLLYCYEMPSPMFGDIGHGVIGDDGLCYIDIDAMFLETIDSLQNYQVFLQSYSDAPVYVVEKRPNYFIIKGVPNTQFDWEIKAKQLDFPFERLEENTQYNFTDEDYETSAQNYLITYEKELIYYE